MIEDDEKNLLKRKIEESKEEKFKFQEKIIRLNSHIDELFQERLSFDENENKLLKLFDAGIINKDGNSIKR